MKNTLIATLVLSLLAISTGPALAQAQPVNVQAVQVDATTDTSTNANVQLNPQPDPPSDEVGGDGEDIGTPSANRGNTNIGSSGDDGVETTGIEHDDIGIADTDGTQAMNKADLINSISTTTTSGADVFIKIGDIKGESEESSSGNTENQFKVEEGESAAKKPKEIVVVGSKVRGWDPVKKEEIRGVAPQRTDEVHNETDLAFLATRLFIENEDVPTEDISLNFEKITWAYRQEAKLLGLFPLSLRHELEVDTRADSYGRIKVRFPWWHVFVSKPVSDVEIVALYDAEVQSLGGGNIMDDPETPLLQRQAQTLQTLSNVSKALHDTAMAIIRKLG